MNKKIVYVNTCVFGTKKMNLLPDYIEKYKGQIGLEVLSMFDLPDFEQKLEKYLPVLQACPISFHGPVFCVEHSAPKGSKEYDESMFHIRKTLKYAKALKSTHLTMHLNNCVVDPEAKERMLSNALDNHMELQALFGDFGCQIYVENTGINYKKNVLLNQDEFTELCIKKHFDVLVDVGHASANQWDIPKLITNLKDQIKAYHLHNEVTIYDIWGVGDTHIESVNTIKAWINMQKEVRVPFYKLEGKSVTEGKYEGQIIALSDDRKCAKLVVETTFTDRQNIMLDIGGDLYAKVIEQTEDYYILRFTSTPEHFNEWVEERI